MKNVFVSGIWRYIRYTFLYDCSMIEMIYHNRSVFTLESVALFCFWRRTNHEAQADGIYSAGVLIFLWMWIRGNYRLQGLLCVLGPVYRVCLGYLRPLGQNFTEQRTYRRLLRKTSNLGPSSCLGRNFWSLESLNIYKMGSNGKVVFALRAVFEGGINITNSTITVLLYNPTNRFHTC